MTVAVRIRCVLRCACLAASDDTNPATILTRAPGNGAPIGGVKVMTNSGWFAARPSGTEDIYKIYAESFRGADHLRRILEEAQAIVGEALAPKRDKGEASPALHRKTAEEAHTV